MASSSGGAGFSGPSDADPDGQSPAPSPGLPIGAGSNETTPDDADRSPAGQPWPPAPAAPSPHPPTEVGPPAEAASYGPGRGQVSRREWAVPGFTELKVLGSGGFGEVVLARHEASGTPVAIKYLLRSLLDDPQFAGMFRAEAAVLASLADERGQAV